MAAALHFLAVDKHGTAVRRDVAGELGRQMGVQGAAKAGALRQELLDALDAHAFRQSDDVADALHLRQIVAGGSEGLVGDLLDGVCGHAHRVLLLMVGVINGRGRTGRPGSRGTG